MNSLNQSGLGTKLRLLLAKLDGELIELYKLDGTAFRPRFYPVFQLLLQSEQATVGEVGNALQATQPAATQTLQQMARLDFISWKRSDDGRERIVALSPHGISTANKLMPTWQAVSAAATDLDRELSFPLGSLLDEAIEALNHKGFADRVGDQLAAKRKSR